MNCKQICITLLIAGGPFFASASASDTKPTSEAYKAAQKKAASQYAADRKLCAEEKDSSARMHCLRDARAEYDKALAEAKKDAASAGEAKASATKCSECARIVEVTVGEKKGEGGALGIIGGGVAGALLGSQVGGGRGKTAATILGAAGGAYAGHKVEEKLKSAKIWSVKVHFDGGEERTIDFDHDPGLKSGDLVRVSGNAITPR